MKNSENETRVSNTIRARISLRRAPGGIIGKTVVNSCRPLCEFITIIIYDNFNVVRGLTQNVPTIINNV